jgi:heavy metal sensor kinase
MKSIRVSLIVYFLALVVLTLGAVLGLLYQNTLRTLEEKQATTEALLLKEHESRHRAVRDQFDREILHRAQNLANFVQYQSVPIGRDIYPVCAAAAAILYPNGQLLAPLWLAAGSNEALARGLMIHPYATIQLPGDLQYRDDDSRAPEYVQISSQKGEILQRSRSMRSMSLPLPGEVRHNLGVSEFHFGDSELAGVAVRYVTLKVPVWRYRAAPRRRQADTPPARPNGEDRFVPTIFIQCAVPTAPRAARLAANNLELVTHQAGLRAMSRETMDKLRNRLIWIGIATFITVMAGACWLIGVGLSSLHRLSDAVSRVSERDFRLKFDSRDLPVELRPISDRLERTLEQLGRAFAREKQAAADISHELRTPLAAMLTTIEVALRKPRTPEKYQEFLMECRTIGRQMTGMVERLLILARMDSGADLVRPQEVDVGSVAEQCVSLVRPLAEARGLRMQLSCGAGTTLHTDPDKLREVLNNLLHNAIDYNRPNGRVDVNVARENGHVQVDIQDTGIGIAPEACERIFERFYRADSSRQAESIHAGVGLSIVKGYVDLMGGTVAVKSQPGRGSTFQVRLPVK